MNHIITFAGLYRSPRWRGPMVVAYGREWWPSFSEWDCPGVGEIANRCAL